ncbi:unnamed protein product, partial [Allacma fusca]
FGSNGQNSRFQKDPVPAAVKMNSKRVLVGCYKLSQRLATNHCTRQLGTTASRKESKVDPGYSKIVDKYRHFQIPDQTPVHLKGGSFDYFLYMSTLILCGVGIAGCLHFYYTSAFPKKRD